MRTKDDTPEKLPARFDPDARFILANDRTMLAWIRTAIALVAGGVVVTHFGNGESPMSLKALAILLIISGMLTAYTGYRRFRAADACIRRGELPGTGSTMAWQTTGVVVISVLLSVAIILD